jgi:hypothetical protein
MPGRQCAYASAASVYGLKYAAPGQSAECGTERGTIDGKLLGENSFGRQTFEQFPAAFEKSLLKFLFN